MPLHNAEIAERLNRLADLMEVEGADPFRVRAYRNAALSVGNLGRDLPELVAAGEKLEGLPGIGRSIANKIKTLVETGTLPQLEKVESRTPAALSVLMKIEGLGPKRVKMLHDALNIRSVEDLERAAREGRIRKLEGFGKKSEEMILQHARDFQPDKQRTPLAEAEDFVRPLVAYLEKAPGVKQLTVAGSYRRRKETVGDLDILATAKKGSPIMDHFVAYDEVSEVVSRGRTRSTVVLRSGLHVDLRVVPQVSYGAALCYFTGSKAHNIALRKRGVKKGYKINEYGVFKGERRIGGKTEGEVYEKLGMDYVEPELRENRGEIEAAPEGRLPELVTLEDIRGDLHCHTRATDGHHSLKQMAEAARARGYEYLAITDHTKRVAVARGLNAKRLREEIREIDRLNEKLDGIRLLKSAEVDILEDGSLDLPDSVLKELDLAVCAIHYHVNLPEKKQTERILRAMDNRYFTVLAHPTGRLINRRDAYEVDMQRLMEAARERGCFLEIDSQPTRLDLPDVYCQEARKMGLKFTISSDAHSIDNLDFIRFGVGQARRGWLEPGDVLNTRPLDELLKAVRR